MPAKAKGFRGHQAADRLVFATCETHCETVAEMDEIPILYNPRCIMGVWAAEISAVGLVDFIGRYCKGWTCCDSEHTAEARPDSVFADACHLYTNGYNA